MAQPVNIHRTTAQVLLSPRVSPQVVTSGRRDGGSPFALPTRPYACPLPSHHARSQLACSDIMRCASPRTCAARADKDALERRRRSAVVAPATLALGAALYKVTDTAAQVRRCAELHARAHGALASHLSLCCLSWHTRCSSCVLARVHVCVHVARAWECVRARDACACVQVRVRCSCVRSRARALV